MTNYVMEKRIPNKIHNITTLKCSTMNVYIDRITGIDSLGREVLLMSHKDYAYDSIAFLYTKENINIMRIYYSNTIELQQQDMQLISSFSKYVKSGYVQTETTNHNFCNKIAINIECENIGDAHISAIIGLAVQDETGQQIYGKDIFMPISSDSVLYDDRIINDYSRMYGYIDNILVEDESLLVERDDILRFMVPKNTDSNISLFGNTITINEILGQSISVNIRVNILNTNFTSIDHTPIIKRIGMVTYNDNKLS